MHKLDRKFTGDLLAALENILHVGIAARFSRPHQSIILCFAFTRKRVMGWLIFLVLLLGMAHAQNSTGEATISCPVVVQEPLTPYGFATANLVSLWYARNAAEKLDDASDDDSYHALNGALDNIRLWEREKRKYRKESSCLR
jgi:hypothetical protein